VARTQALVRPRGSVVDAWETETPAAPVIPAQLTLPVPFDTMIPRGIPLPSEVLPPPVLPPNISPLNIPRNRYPGRRKCVKEWAEATRDCLDLWADGKLRTDDYRGMGETVADCIMGRVTQECGGNMVA